MLVQSEWQRSYPTYSFDVEFHRDFDVIICKSHSDRTSIRSCDLNPPSLKSAISETSNSPYSIEFGHFECVLDSSAVIIHAHHCASGMLTRRMTEPRHKTYGGRTSPTGWAHQTRVARTSPRTRKVSLLYVDLAQHAKFDFPTTANKCNSATKEIIYFPDLKKLTMYEAWWSWQSRTTRHTITEPYSLAEHTRPHNIQTSLQTRKYSCMLILALHAKFDFLTCDNVTEECMCFPDVKHACDAWSLALRLSYDTGRALGGRAAAYVQKTMALSLSEGISKIRETQQYPVTYAQQQIHTYKKVRRNSIPCLWH